MHTDQAVQLMDEFGARTELTSSHAPVCYLWTDAFAVCNFSGLTDATGAPDDLELASRLIDQVHHTVGCQVEKMAASDGRPELEHLERSLALRPEIVGFWTQPQHRQVSTWHDHQDINDVMLATAEVPEGCML